MSSGDERDAAPAQEDVDEGAEEFMEVPAGAASDEEEDESEDDEAAAPGAAVDTAGAGGALGDAAPGAAVAGGGLGGVALAAVAAGGGPGVVAPSGLGGGMCGVMAAVASFGGNGMGYHDLLAQQKASQAQLRRASTNVHNAQRKRQRLIIKAQGLSDADLIAILQDRQRARATAQAKAAPKAAPNPAPKPAPKPKGKAAPKPKAKAKADSTGGLAAFAAARRSFASAVAATSVGQLCEAAP